MPGKDDNDVWHNSCRNRLKVSVGVQYEGADVPPAPAHRRGYRGIKRYPRIIFLERRLPNEREETE